MEQAPLENHADLEKEKKREEIEKLKLEKIKLELEGKELKKSWYRKPQWWGFLFPTIISTIWLVSNGFFSNNFTLLNIREENLKLAIKKLNTERDSIHASVNTKQKELDSTKFQLKIAGDSLAKYREQISYLDSVQEMLLKSKSVSGVLRSVLKEKFNKEIILQDSIKSMRNQLIVCGMQEHGYERQIKRFNEKLYDAEKKIETLIDENTKLRSRLTEDNP